MRIIRVVYLVASLLIISFSAQASDLMYPDIDVWVEYEEGRVAIPSSCFGDVLVVDENHSAVIGLQLNESYYDHRLTLSVADMDSGVVTYRSSLLRGGDDMSEHHFTLNLDEGHKYVILAYAVARGHQILLAELNVTAMPKDLAAASGSF